MEQKCEAGMKLADGNNPCGAEVQDKDESDWKKLLLVAANIAACARCERTWLISDKTRLRTRLFYDN